MYVGGQLVAQLSMPIRNIMYYYYLFINVDITNVILISNNYSLVLLVSLILLNTNKFSH